MRSAGNHKAFIFVEAYASETGGGGEKLQGFLF